jgi:hypothetical protein
MNKILLLSVLSALLLACNQEQPVRTYTDKEGVVHEVSRETSGSSGGMMEHMAGAAVAGAAAGAAGAAAHRATDHAINKWQERKEANRYVQRQPRTFHHGPPARRR